MSKTRQGYCTYNPACAFQHRRLCKCMCVCYCSFFFFFFFITPPRCCSSTCLNKTGDLSLLLKRCRRWVLCKVRCCSRRCRSQWVTHEHESFWRAPSRNSTLLLILALVVFDQQKQLPRRLWGVASRCRCLCWLRFTSSHFNEFELFTERTVIWVFIIWVILRSRPLFIAPTRWTAEEINLTFQKQQQELIPAIICDLHRVRVGLMASQGRVWGGKL